MERVIAIDPGREKCGLAVVDRESGVIWQGIVSTVELAGKVEALTEEYSLSLAIMGNGTGHQSALSALEERVGSNLRVETVDEFRSTDEARSRFWRENPPKGLRRFIPIGLQSPPRPVDDYVAVILAERYFNRR